MTRIKPKRLTQYIISNSQFSHNAFPTLEVARVTRRDAHHFLRKFSSTGTDNNIGSTTNLARYPVRTYYARTLRKYSLFARSECHRSALIRNTSHHRYKPSLPSSHFQHGVPTASHFCFYHPVEGSF